MFYNMHEVPEACAVVATAPPPLLPAAAERHCTLPDCCSSTLCLQRRMERRRREWHASPLHLPEHGYMPKASLMASASSCAIIPSPLAS